MKKEEITDRRYPIGKFEYGKKYTLDATRKHIKVLARFPKELKKVLKKLRRDELDMSYRKDGWTVRQVVHHIADSHMNAYIRTKLAVTEQTPIIKPYEEQLWAETEDGKRGSVKMSLRIITALHRRWVVFLESLSEDDLERGYFHPTSGRVVAMQEVIALYVWHSQHHLAHIKMVADNESEAKETPTRKSMASDAGDSTKSKRGRPKGGASTAKAAAAPAPKMSREEVMAKARAARMANLAAAAEPAPSAKPGRRKGTASAAKAAAAPAPKMSREEVMAKARAARMAKLAAAAAAAEPVVEPAQAAKRGRPKGAASTEKAAAASAPKMSRNELLAKARAARMAKLAAAAAAAEPVVEPAQDAKRGRPKGAASAAKTVAAPAPKMSRDEILAKARAARMANRATTAAAAEPVVEPAQDAKRGRPKGAASAEKAVASAVAPPPPTTPRKRRSSEEVAAAKAAKAAASAPKQKGMSPEHMARIRAARTTKRAADIAAGRIPAPKPKPAKDSATPKMSREEVMAKARAARFANLAAKKAEKDKG